MTAGPKKIDAPPDLNADAHRASQLSVLTEGQFRSIFNSIDEGFGLIELIFDDKGRVVDYWLREANRRYEQLTGLADSVGRRGTKVLRYIEPEWLEKLETVYRTGEAVRFEYPRSPLGRIYTAHLSRVGGEGSRLIAIVFDDVTERRRYEEVLRESAEKLKIGAEVARLGSWELDLTTNVLDCSDICKANFGVKADEDLSYTRVFELIHPEDRELVRAAVKAAIETRTDYQAEYRTVWPDGSTHWIVALGRAFYANDGTPLKMVGVKQNITERKRAEGSLVFLAELSDSLLKWTTNGKTMALGAMIGEYFGLGHCLFIEVDDEEENVEIRYCWHRPDLPEISGSYRIADFVGPDFARRARAGETIVARDLTDDTVSDPERFLSLGIRSFIAVPLVRDGKWRFTLGAYASQERDWRPDEIELMREITTRIWTRLERARAEKALRASEEFNRSLMSGSADCVKVLDPEGRLLLINEPGMCLLEIDDFGSVCGQAWWELWPQSARDDIAYRLSWHGRAKRVRFRRFARQPKALQNGGM